MVNTQNLKQYTKEKNYNEVRCLVNIRNIR